MNARKQLACNNERTCRTTPECLGLIPAEHLSIVPSNKREVKEAIGRGSNCATGTGGHAPRFSAESILYFG